MYEILSKIWNLFQSNTKWHLLWIFHNKFMIGVSGIVFNKDQKILLLKHRFWKKDSWGLPSGYIKKRETLEHGLAREVKEETGLNIKVDRLININSGFKLRIECTFVGQCEDMIIQDKINEGEILDAKFYSVDELPVGLLETHRKLIYQVVRDL